MCSVEILIPTIFALRNGVKCFKEGDATRGEVSGAQTLTVLDRIAQSDSIFGPAATKANKALKFIDSGIEKGAKAIGQTEKLDKLVESSNAVSKAGALAQKLVNPLLCVAAGVRILKDEDQYSALVEETAAMGAMFGAEKLMKTGKNIFYNSACDLIDSSQCKNTITKTLSNLGTKFGTLTKGRKTLVQTGIGLAFVAGSILAYDTGKKLGKALTGRNNNTENNNT